MQGTLTKCSWGGGWDMGDTGMGEWTKGRSRYLLRRGRASEGEREMDGKILGGSVHTTFYEIVKE